MSHNKIFLVLSCICIFFAFLFGYLYALREIELSEKQEDIYIDISTSSRSITIKNSPEHIFFRVNNELMQSGSINLK